MDESPVQPDQTTEPPKPKKKKRLTRKQAKLARERVKDPNATLSELGLKAGYTYAQGTKRALELDHVQDRMREIMAAHPDTSMKGLHKKLSEGLNATKIERHAFQGSVITENVDIDYGTRHRYLETASEWAGLAEKRVRVSGDEAAPLSLAAALDILKRAQSIPEA